MSVVVKGFQGAVHTNVSTRYDAENRTTTYTYEYSGVESAIMGLVFQLRARGVYYRTHNRGPIFFLETDEPLTDVDENIDRWEIFTESAEKSLFELPDIVAEASAHDAAAIGNDDDSYKKTVETIAESPSTTYPSGANVELLVRHLRAQVTGWQVDWVVLRRLRRLERFVANNNIRMTLDTGLLLYTTAQLGLPTDVAFALPSTPSDVTFVKNNVTYTLFKWRWRKRSQRSEYVGGFVEHTAELVFAPWSTLAYQDSNSALQW